MEANRRRGEASKENIYDHALEGPALRREAVAADPAFTLVAVASLGLGIGANTAIFQLLDTVGLRTLPVQNPQQLATVKIANRDRVSGAFSSEHPDITNPQWEQIREHQQAFSGIAAWSNETFNLARGGQVRNAQGIWVSGDFFNVLGVPPVLGRVFTAADDRRGCGSPRVVISYSFWQREFGGQASALGKTLTLNGYPFAVIGVTREGFNGIEVARVSTSPCRFAQRQRSKPSTRGSTGAMAGGWL